MDVPLKSWHIVTLTLYSATVAFVAILLSWPVPFTLFLLCGLPLVLLIFEAELPLARLLATVGILASVIVVLDGVAHTTGAWYTSVTSSWRIFGVTFDSLLFAFVHTFFFLVLYEYLLDDGKVKKASINRSVKALAVVLTLLVSSFYLFSVWIVSFAFLWMIVLMLFLILSIMVLGHEGNSVALLQKSLMFGLMMLPLSIAFEMVALHGGVRIFAFSSEYLTTFSLFGESLPLEEFLLLLVWPTLLVAMYESFIDDGK